MIYTDGSATGGVRNGGSAAVVTRGAPETPQQVARLLSLGSKVTCSFKEEVQGMKLALSWCEEQPRGTRVLICTDSQALCTALLHDGDGEIRELSNRIHSCCCSLTLQWIPSHCNIPGNEMADSAAKEACRLDGDGGPIDYLSCKVMVKAAVADPPIAHERSAAVYAGHSRRRDKQEIKSRRDQVELARLRSGHHMALRWRRTAIVSTRQSRHCVPSVRRLTRTWCTGGSAQPCWPQEGGGSGRRMEGWKCCQRSQPKP